MIVGLTGGMGSGKSVVAQQFSAYGIDIIDADHIAKALVVPQSPALDAIVHHFGTWLLHPSGELNRSALRDLIFQDPAERVWLERLLHPAIMKEVEQHITTLTSPYGILMAPLLLETQTPMRKTVQRILVVDCPTELQIQRIKTRDHLTGTQITAILNTQHTRQQRLEAADDILNNDTDLAELKRQIDVLHRKYLSLVA